MSDKRRYYIDNIRSFGIILVLIYHVFYIYNGIGVLGGFPISSSIGIFDDFLTIVYPWMMILLFVAAGIAAKCSLEKRTGKQFISERLQKLIIPSVLGLFVVHWVTGYINMYLGGGLSTIPSFIVYPISVLAGSGHLWFAHVLFLYSTVLALFKKPIDKLKKLGERANLFISLVFGILIWLGAQILNMPIITVYRFGIYFVAFLIGYCVFSHESIMKKLEKSRYISLALTIVFGVVYFVLFRKMNYTEPEVLKSIITNFYAWCAVLAIFGFGRRYLDKENAFSRYLATNSYGYYVLHYPILMCSAYLLHIYTDLGVPAKIFITLIMEIVLTFVANEIIKRIPLVRYLVLGIKRRKNEIQIDN